MDNEHLFDFNEFQNYLLKWPDGSLPDEKCIVVDPILERILQIFQKDSKNNFIIKYDFIL